MLSQSTTVVSYANYRLKSRKVVSSTSETELLSRTKESFDGLYLLLETFNGKQYITSLNLLSTIREGLDQFYVGFSLLSFYIEGSAKSVCTAQNLSGARTTIVLKRTWPQVAHTLIRRFLTDDNVQEAYWNVMSVTKMGMQ